MHSFARGLFILTGTFVLTVGIVSAQGTITVSPSGGTASSVIPIEVPAFRGLEPSLALAYSSGAGNGKAGVGWDLTGFGIVERTSASGHGAPLYNATDKFLLNGVELLPCTAQNASSSCLAGGTHATKWESYQRIAYDGAANTWTVWNASGTRFVYRPLYSFMVRISSWGLSSVTDLLGNTVTYTWYLPDGDAYPWTVEYNGYRVMFYWESRLDVESRGTGWWVAKTLFRLRSVFVTLSDGTPIRAYKLSYDKSGSTGRSILTSVQRYGRDVAHDGSGRILTGAALPPWTFSYETDAEGYGTFKDGSAWISGWCSSGLTTGDFNGDGRTDLSCNDAGTGAVRIALSDGERFVDQGAWISGWCNRTGQWDSP